MPEMSRVYGMRLVRLEELVAHLCQPVAYGRIVLDTPVVRQNLPAWSLVMEPPTPTPSMSAEVPSGLPSIQVVASAQRSGWCCRTREDVPGGSPGHDGGRC